MKLKRVRISVTVAVLSIVLLTGCNKTRQAQQSYDNGLGMLEEAEYTKAKEAFSEAVLESDSKKAKTMNKKAYYGMGVAYFKQQEWEKASDCFNNALKLDVLPSWNVQIQKYQADTLSRLSDFKGALSILMEIRKEETKNVDLILEEYYVLEKMGKTKEGADLLNEGLSIKGFGTDYKFNRAKLYFYLGNMKSAKEGMEAAQEKEIQEANFYLGQIYEKEEEYEKALDYYRVYQENTKSPGDSLALSMAGCYEKSGQNEKALAAYDSGLKQSDGTLKKELWYCKIVLLEKELRFDEAYKESKLYRKAYKDDVEMKRESEFLRTRTSN